jgi:hypothetical protein
MRRRLDSGVVRFVRQLPKGWWALVLCCLGCGLGKSGYERFVPADDRARAALQAVLDAWKEGQPTSRITTSSLAVEVADSQRRPGQKLTTYEILGEVPGDGPNCFAVRLELDKPRQELKVRYIVIGLDPIWVFRHEDFQMMEHWDMKNMAGQATASPPAR